MAELIVHERGRVGQPQLVAMLHSFVGAAAVAVGFATLLASGKHYAGTGAEGIIHAGEIFVGVCVGSITFTGSLIAAAKLHGVISGKPLLLPARHALNLAMLAATIVLGLLFARNLGQAAPQLTWLILATLITAVLGAHLVAAIGERLGPFQLAALPIGAYEPAAMMGTVHLNPEQAVAAAADLRAERVLGVHWGTFDLTDEPLDEPPARLHREAARRKKA